LKPSTLATTTVQNTITQIETQPTQFVTTTGTQLLTATVPSGVTSYITQSVTTLIPRISTITTTQPETTTIAGSEFSITSPVTIVVSSIISTETISDVSAQTITATSILPVVTTQMQTSTQTTTTTSTSTSTTTITRVTTVYSRPSFSGYSSITVVPVNVTGGCSGPAGYCPFDAAVYMAMCFALGVNGTECSFRGSLIPPDGNITVGQPAGSDVYIVLYPEVLVNYPEGATFGNGCLAIVEWNFPETSGTNAVVQIPIGTVNLPPC